MNNAQYFDFLAETWDSLVDHPIHRVAYAVDRFGIKRGWNALDVGSGTGILLPFLAERVGLRRGEKSEASGRLVALDISKKMIEVSRRKFSQLGAQFVVEDFLRYENSDSFDLIAAYSCFPHFLDKAAFFKKANELLRARGILAIAHIEGRKSINALHDGPEGPPSAPLPPIAETVAQAERKGFRPVWWRDDEEYYIAILEKVGSIDSRL